MDEEGKGTERDGEKAFVESTSTRHPSVQVWTGAEEISILRRRAVKDVRREKVF